MEIGKRYCRVCPGLCAQLTGGCDEHFAVLVANEGVSVQEYVDRLTGTHLLELLSDPEEIMVVAAMDRPCIYLLHDCKTNQPCFIGTMMEGSRYPTISVIKKF